MFCEQGLGDVVQFARFVPAARERVGELVFVVDGYWRTLAPLLASLAGVDHLLKDAVAVEALERSPAARTSVLSLAYLLDVVPDRLPGPIPYLAAPADRVGTWAPRVAALPGLKVGLAWSALHRGDHGYLTRHKSVPVAALAPLVARSGASFVSLQPGAAGDRTPLGALADRIADWTPEFRDFGDTAAIIAALDLVITTDTAVAHVAGALGKPVWLLDRYNACWRWRLDPVRSPWYPTLTIFRQDAFLDWSRTACRRRGRAGASGLRRPRVALRYSRAPDAPPCSTRFHVAAPRGPATPPPRPETAMPSFDIVSEVNQVEVRNALDQANKEISTRFDFKGSDSRVEYDGKALTLYADDEFKLGQVMDVLGAKFAKRQVDSRSLKDGDIEKISGNKVKRLVTVRTGVEQETAKKIVKLLKESKIKVQGSIQGDSVRVSGAKRDDLQAAIALVKGAVTDYPLQYENFRD